MGTDGTDHPGRRLDTQALSGLAHPLRVALFQQLTQHGPATATQLGERLGESSGSTSYHLRQLERFGFVETDPERGNGRERWWRRVPGGVLIDPPDRHADPAGYEAAHLVIGELRRGRRERQEHFVATIDEWPTEWQKAALDRSVHLVLTPDEACELTRQLNGVIEAWLARAGADAGNAREEARSAEVQVSLFPLPDPR